jgi:hypothetical protein
MAWCCNAWVYDYVKRNCFEDEELFWRVLDLLNEPLSLRPAKRAKSAPRPMNHGLCKDLVQTVYAFMCRPLAEVLAEWQEDVIELPNNHCKVEGTLLVCNEGKPFRLSIS